MEKILFDWNNIESAFIGKESIGLINFTENISVAGLNLDNLIAISHNLISLNPVQGLNKKAILTLYGLNYTFTPVPMKDGIVCTGCTVLDYSSGNFKFNVTGFSSYSSSSNSKLSLSITNGYSLKIIPDEMVYFYANYTNRTNLQSVNGTGSGCNISFGGNYLAMAFNSSLSAYSYNRSFENRYERTYTQGYNVSCFGNILGYEDLNYSSSVDVELNATLLSLAYNLEGFYGGTSSAVGDLNNDGLEDLVIMGVNDSIVNYALIYYNNQSSFNGVNKTVIEGYQLGTLGLVDYNKDGNLDIYLDGLRIGTIVGNKILKN